MIKYIQNKLLSYLCGEDIELKYSKCCNSKATLKRVGDNKEYFVFFCSKCGKTFVSNDCARCFIRSAKKEWNKVN